MAKTKQYSPEVGERAARPMVETRKDYAARRATIESIAPKTGCAAVTLHDWTKTRDRH